MLMENKETCQTNGVCDDSVLEGKLCNERHHLWWHYWGKFHIHKIVNMNSRNTVAMLKFDGGTVYKETLLFIGYKHLNIKR